MSRQTPPAITGLPEQFFTQILAAAAHARSLPGPRVIDLGRGNPDLPPPPPALEALAGAPATTTHGYPPFQGLPELREAIARRYRRDHGVTLDPEREVAVLPGTKTGIVLACVAAAGPGASILLPDPGYPDYHSGVALAGATGRILPLDAGAGWQPDWDAVPDDGTAALAVLNYPSNPCATCEAPGTFERAVAEVQDRMCWLLHDLAYGFLAFDGRRARSVLEADGARDVAVELWSPSKVHGAAGWRVGFLVGAAELVGRVRVLMDHVAAGVWSGLQEALIVALDGDQAEIDARREVYRRRRDRLVGALQAAGADMATPEGSFYAWWRLPAGLDPAVILERARVAVAPGEGFGGRGRGYVRLSLAVADEDLDEGAERLAALLTST